MLQSMGGSQRQKDSSRDPARAGPSKGFVHSPSLGSEANPTALESNFTRSAGQARAAPGDAETGWKQRGRGEYNSDRDSKWEDLKLRLEKK